MNAAWEQVVVGLERRGPDPHAHSVTGGRRDLELDGSLGLVLHHDGTRGDLVTVAEVAHLERNEVAPAKLAVNAQVEEGEFPYPLLHLQPKSKSPDVPQLERSLLSDDLAFVPCTASA